jgi:hypothetical protein
VGVTLPLAGFAWFTAFAWFAWFTAFAAAGAKDAEPHLPAEKGSLVHHRALSP